MCVQQIDSTNDDGQYSADCIGSDEDQYADADQVCEIDGDAIDTDTEDRMRRSSLMDAAVGLVYAEKYLLKEPCRTSLHTE